MIPDADKGLMMPRRKQVTVTATTTIYRLTTTATVLTHVTKLIHAINNLKEIKIEEENDDDMMTMMMMMIRWMMRMMWQRWRTMTTMIPALVLKIVGVTMKVKSQEWVTDALQKKEWMQRTDEKMKNSKIILTCTACAVIFLCLVPATGQDYVSTGTWTTRIQPSIKPTTTVRHNQRPPIMSTRTVITINTQTKVWIRRQCCD